MYCKATTLKLACEKGFTQCTCTAGGYPDCICDRVPYGNVRLDDIQRWLREDKLVHIKLDHNLGYMAWKFILVELNKTIKGAARKNVFPFSEYGTFENALEYGIVHALNLI